MIHLKSRMSKILGKIEELEKGSTLTAENLYPLLEQGYLLISDYFEIDQCHSIIHLLRAQMREIDHFDNRNNQGSSENGNVLEEARKTAVDELRIFISHL
jgi:hypothetical protein